MPRDLAIRWTCFGGAGKEYAVDLCCAPIRKTIDVSCFVNFGGDVAVSLAPSTRSDTIGTVLFVDAGNVWKDDEDIDLADLNWSTGFGFRIGLSNLPRQPLLRVDLGWTIGEQSDFAVTVGTEQQF
jgi:outer membrane protein assembly factor BamA